MAKKQEPRFALEPLGEKQHRAAFSCDVEALDSYLHKQAGQDARKRAAVPFVATTDGQTIAGYYTQIASAGVIVDARDESAAGFYRRYGFVELPKIEKRLFLPMGTVERLFRKGR
ncbi:MAG: hypothetical protein DMG53_17015 [Acidobacteria bacterium]|nr:MAG: hypothetical protein DMG53_17015 [Acidobacteriota bacterium]